MKIAEEEIIIAQNSKLFRNIGNQEVEKLVAAGQVCKLKGGAHYFLEDDPADTGYLLLAGKIKLT